MPGSTKEQREIYEQYVIFKKYDRRWKELGQLINKRNPVGGRYDFENPQDLKRFYNDAEKIADYWNLPKEFKKVDLNFFKNQ